MKVVKRERITDALVDECNTMDNINARLPKPESEDETKWIASDNNNSPKWTSIAPTAGVVKTLSAAAAVCAIDGQPHKTSAGKYKEEIMNKRRVTKGRSQLCRYTVDRVQGILLPQKVSSYIPVSVNELDDHKATFRHPTRIPLIVGLERVTSGAQPASEVVSTCGMKPHRFVWFIISGCLCDIVQFFIDVTLFYVLKIKSNAICWLLGYSISIVVRHTSHRYLVFGNYVGGYLNSLLRMYTLYGIILLLSTLFNLAMTEWMHFKHYTAWIVTLVCANVMTYCLLTRLWNWDWWSRGSIDVHRHRTTVV